VTNSSALHSLHPANLMQNRFVRFLLVGGSSTLIQFVLLIALVELLQMPKVYASALSYALSAVYNYLLNYHFTFSSDQQHRETAPKYILAVGLGLSINTAVFCMLLTLLPHYIFAQVGATLTALVVNFLVQKYWIFRISK